MPNSNYIKICLDGQDVELNNTGLDISISYNLEDAEDFTKKKSSEAFNVTIPATVNNDKLGNTFHNPSIEDMTTGKVFRGYREGMIEANGDELLVGKAFLTNATHTDRPVSYQYDFYGNNGDWMIDLKETTLFDLLKHIRFKLTAERIQDSWTFTGDSELLPYVFAPVRYRQPFDFYDDSITDGNYKDDNATSLYMRPSLSVYWIIYWGFKSVGYKIKSDFFATNYFKRLVMPWTWCNFLSSEGNRQDNLRFLAKGTERITLPNFTNGYLDVKATNTNTEGGFNPNNLYTYNATTGEMTWAYSDAYRYGSLEFHFNLQVDWYAFVHQSQSIVMGIEWYIDGAYIETHVIADKSTTAFYSDEMSGIKEDTFVCILDNEFSTHTVTAKIKAVLSGEGSGPSVNLQVLQLSLDYMRVPIGGTVDFENYTAFKNYKFLDFLAGVVDAFNLLPGTDPHQKVVLLEPAHIYTLDDNFISPRQGYFNGDHTDWSQKQDLSQVSTMELFRDYEKEVTMKFKDDSSDGILKLIQDRNSNVLAAAKYVFPERFKADTKSIENRFFSPVMHYQVDQWQNKGTLALKPQLICIIPENISNTSKDEASNTFQPKLAWYKGLVANAGGWRFEGEDKINLPYMFAVNYQPGGESDPVLSYCDEKIGPVRAPGLFRRFFLQRFAIMRNGQFYITNFRLNNKDVTNWFHREHKIVRGERWELVKINDYRPLSEGSTECYLRKWSPITEDDFNSIYPTFKVTAQDKYDTKYSPLKALITDIPGAIIEKL
ncbi:hypothetical protein [Chitinophaga sancti]|uniref:Uncharacterized protein n=1 Tax=Chitinophaga sancti TaxID=1004 RepID=A0A1K1LYQ1_9BACT|nr:hypothetical protein [Chitinophaga sancti]WQD64746.1 hypothetical protein U0033_10095 [Chitinophaga sancti]WQG89632.1 hypothetical protein SR876_32380 [Chitinophaga sancti]SFW15968.1 hypothetical protein SAMN05661012_00325 [Chitinophaga sancti]